MAGKALIRLLLILTLILTAHSLKPLSGGNFAQQVLGAAESISVILPDATANRFYRQTCLQQHLDEVFHRSRSATRLRERFWLRMVVSIDRP